MQYITEIFYNSDSESYNVKKKCLALVNEVCSDSFDVSLYSEDGYIDSRDFLFTYEILFKGIILDNSDEKLVTFRHCCIMTAYTECLAKKYEKYSTTGLLSSVYVDDAEKYRGHADTLWQMLNDIECESDMQEIINYCQNNDIVYLNNITDDAE